MRRFKFGRRRFARTVRRARPIVRAITGHTLSKRVLLHDFNIPDQTAADFDNPVRFDLIGAAEAMDEEVESTGGTTINTDVAAVPLYSRPVALRTNFILRAPSACMVRWMIVKNPDFDLTAANFMTNFHSSDDNATAREVRKNTLAKGFTTVSADRLETRMKFFISRSAWKRLGTLREGDRLEMVLAKEGAGTTAALSGFATVWVKANG